MNPSFDFITIFAQGLTSIEVMLAVIGMVSAAAFAVLLATRFGSWILPSPRESRVSDFLPFDRLDEDGATIHLRNGALARVFEVKGVDSTLMSPEDRAALTGARKRWIDAMAELEIVVRLMTVRDKVQLETMEAFKDSKLLKAIDDLWMENMHRLFKNHHYIVLSVNDRKEAVRDLDQACNALTSIMDMYDPVLLSEDATINQEDKSEYLIFRQNWSWKKFNQKCFV